MRLKRYFGTCVLAALCGVALSAEVRAADLGPLYDAPATPYAVPDQPFEFGTGWYLRGDGAYAEEDQPKFNNASATFAPNTTASGYALGVGAGYKLTSFLRMDLTGDYLDRFNYAGNANCGSNCAITSTAKIWRFDGLANAYADLGTWYGLTPYIGAGVGFSGAIEDARVITTSGGATQLAKAHNDDFELAWAAMAGVSYAFTPHAMIDIGYRYLDLGTMAIALTPLATVHKEITEQQVRVGLRYMVD